MNKSFPPAPRGRLVVSLCVLLLGTAASRSRLKPKQIQQQGFEIIGIPARTNNAAESAGEGVIPKLWGRFYSDSDTSFDRIPAKAGNSVYAAYTAYDNDAAGDYTFVLGARVKPGTRPPEGMVAIQVPAGKYLEFTSEQGSLPTLVPKLWRDIYAYFRQAGTLQRAFKTDYEIYDAGMDPMNATATIYVGVK